MQATNQGSASGSATQAPNTVTNQKHASTADWLLVATPGVIWGASFLFIAEGLRAIAPNGVSFIRIAIGFATLSFFPAARKRIDRSAWPGIVALSILWFAFPLSMFPFAEQRVSSALTGMLNATTPLFVTIVAAALARKIPSGRILLGLLTGIGGSVLIALPSFSEGKSSAFGILLIVIACISYGFALNVARPLQMRYGALPVIWRALGCAVLMTAPLGVIEIPRAHWSLVPVLSLLALGAFGTSIANVILTVAAGRVGAIQASGATFLMPPVALLLGVWLRHEHVAIVSIVGGAVCLAGAWMIRPRPNAQPVTPTTAKIAAS
jgi:drug/metabolite transporter (DMT)-like permease